MDATAQGAWEVRRAAFPSRGEVRTLRCCPHQRVEESVKTRPTSDCRLEPQPSKERRSVMVSIRWVGEVEGSIWVEDPGADAREIDRPGDAFVLLQEFIRNRHPEIAGLAAYAVCLSTRGVSESHFMRQIYRRSFDFVRGADLASKTLYDVITRLQELLASCESEGVELRERFLAEAHQIQAESTE